VTAHCASVRSNPSRDRYRGHEVSGLLVFLVEEPFTGTSPRIDHGHARRHATAAALLDLQNRTDAAEAATAAHRGARPVLRAVAAASEDFDIDSDRSEPTTVRRHV
jgi:hypothetical protein